MTWDANGSPVPEGHYCVHCDAWHEVAGKFLGAVVVVGCWTLPENALELKGEPGETVRAINVASPEPKP